MDSRVDISRDDLLDLEAVVIARAGVSARRVVPLHAVRACIDSISTPHERPPPRAT